MCIILDANAAGLIMSGNIAAKPVLSRVAKGSLRIVSGHRLKDELLRTSFRGLYGELLKAGKLVEINAPLVEEEIKALKGVNLRSNDHHIVALAKTSGARILYSGDKDLHKDFKNTKVINDPKGVVYQNESHTALLDEMECHCSV